MGKRTENKLQEDPLGLHYYTTGQLVFGKW